MVLYALLINGNRKLSLVVFLRKDEQNLRLKKAKIHFLFLNLEKS